MAIAMAALTALVAPGAQAVSPNVGTPMLVDAGAGHSNGGAAEHGLRPAAVACETRETASQTNVDTTVVASAAGPRREGGSTSLPAAALEPVRLRPDPHRRLHLKGQKYASPVGARTEAGVALSLGTHVSIQLNYARTAQVPMMGYANDNGILARLRVGF
jgi:hypothetical protein